MNLYSRNFTNIIHWFLDNIVPPLLRDSKYFIYPLMWLACGCEAKLFLEFKEKFPFMSDSELAEYYRRTVDIPLQAKRKTDLNSASLEYIVKSSSDITGNVLDVGFGSGYLLNEIASKNPNVQCHGADFVVRHTQYATPIVVHKVDIANSMPFPDHSFDLVLCTHVLEHLRNPHKVL